ncbi:MAG: trigger factor [Magnetococcales bacterium]|nr:trigger factor [Magnetococcales bacterium]
MEINVVEKNKFEYTVNICIPASRVDELVEQEFGSVVKMAHVPGFRPGKAPRSVLEARYLSYVLDQVKQKLFEESSDQAMRQHELKMLSPPHVELGQLQRGKEFAYTMNVYVKPALEPCGYEGIAIQRFNVALTDDDIHEAVEKIRRGIARYQPIPEGEQAQQGDRVHCDLRPIMVQGEPVAEEWRATDPIVLDQQSTRSEAVDQLLGIRVGELRQITTDLQTPDADPSGQNGWSVELLVKKIDRPILPTDEEFCAMVGIEGKEDGIAQIRQKVTEHLSDEVQRVVHHHLKSQVYKAILQANPLDLPDGLIHDRLEQMVEDKKQYLAKQGENWQKFWPDEQSMKDFFFGHARDSLAGTFLMMAIGEKNGMKPGKEIIESYLDHGNFNNSPQQRQEAEAYIWQNIHQEDKQQASDFMVGLIESEVTRWIVDHAHVTDESISYEMLKQRLSEEPKRNQ